MRRRLLLFLSLFVWTACSGDTLGDHKDTAPVVSAGPARQAEVGQTLSFQGSATPATGQQIASWGWDFGDGSKATVQNATHAYAGVGTFQAKLTATDGEGLSGSGTATVTITAAGTTPSLVAVIAGPKTGSSGETLTFDGSMSTPTSAVDSWTWTFGDGTTGSGATVTHAFATDGTFDITLTVADAQGAHATSGSWPVVVSGAAATLPSPSGWSYEPNDPNAQGCGGFGTGPLSIAISGTSISLTESGGGTTTVYTGTYDPATLSFTTSASVIGGGSQGLDCTFSADYQHFTGNYFIDVPILSCDMTIPVTGTRTSP